MGGVGWIGVYFDDYDPVLLVDLVKLVGFLCHTQPEAAAALGLPERCHGACVSHAAVERGH